MTRPTCHHFSRLTVHERRFGSLRAALWCVLVEAQQDARAHAAIEQAERAGV